MELVTMPFSQRVASEPVMRRKARSSRGKMAALVRMAASSDFVSGMIFLAPPCFSGKVLIGKGLGGDFDCNC